MVIKVLILFLQIKQWHLLPRFGPGSVFETVPGVSHLWKALLWLGLFVGWKEPIALPLFQEADTKISTLHDTSGLKEMGLKSLILFTASAFSAINSTRHTRKAFSLRSKLITFKRLLSTMQSGVDVTRHLAWSSWQDRCEGLTERCYVGPLHQRSSFSSYRFQLHLIAQIFQLKRHFSPLCIIPPGPSPFWSFLRPKWDRREEGS